MSRSVRDLLAYGPSLLLFGAAANSTLRGNQDARFFLILVILASAPIVRKVHAFALSRYGETRFAFCLMQVELAFASLVVFNVLVLGSSAAWMKSTIIPALLCLFLRTTCAVIERRKPGWIALEDSTPPGLAASSNR